jgi:predicted nucleic acid-binding protein
MIVIDASAAVDLLLENEPWAGSVEGRLRLDPGGVAAPYLLDAEVGQVLRRFVTGGRVTEARARQALQDLRDLPLARYPHEPLLGRAFDLRANATFYDALYLALAEQLGATLLTRDDALATVPGHRARVDVVVR